MWLNESGRDLLVQELQNLNRENDHIHLTAAGPFDLELSDVPYRQDDKCLDFGTILLRPEDWDEEFYPHVLSSDPPLPSP